MNSPAYRAGLPPLPSRMQTLPLSAKGYPVPYFVSWIGGAPDFRVLDEAKLPIALRLGLCWICGQALGRFRAYNVGPLCVINRLSGEPPAHRDCAEYAVRACPFLALPKAQRREAGLTPEQLGTPGVMVKENPGIAAVYITAQPPVPAGGFLGMGEPSEVLWFCEGRPATRSEVLAAVAVAATRLPAQLGPLHQQMLARALSFAPAAVSP